MTDDTPKPEFPRRTSKASGSHTGWSVEVRLADYKKPFILLGMVITNKWKKFEAQPGPGIDAPVITIPLRPSTYNVLENFRLMEYPAAQALRWTLHAHFEMDIFESGLALETRLIKHHVTYDFTCTAKSEEEIVSGEDRSSVIPNWNRKEGDTFVFQNGKLIKVVPEVTDPAG